MKSKIKNFKELSTNKIRKAALLIAEAAFSSIDTMSVVKNNISYDGENIKIKDKFFPASKFKRFFIIGVGKCSMEAAIALEEIFNDKITDGLVIDLNCFYRPKKVKFYKGDHPMPTEANIDATKKIIKMLEGMNEEDLVIFIVSGGGSTLLCQPQDLTCIQEKDILSCLTKEGANIKEINTVRKHISLARGGQLAKYAYPANVISLIFSDVSEDIDFVASGPTFLDNSTVKDAEAVIEKYGVLECIGLEKLYFIETPKEQKYFEKVENILLISNKNALEAMSDKALELGLRPKIMDKNFSGEARDVGENIAKTLHEKERGTVLLYGGETTVTIRNPIGKGGRNQELALSALSFIEEDELLMSFNTDGRDNGDHAGAFVDIETKKKIGDMNLNPKEFLDNNNSYEFFEKTGDYLETDYTGSNISDLIVAIKK